MSYERRRFFRITDQVGVAYRVLTEEEINNSPQNLQVPVDVFNLLTTYDSKIEKLLSQLQSKEPLVHDILVQMNRKMNCIVNQMEMDSRMVERIAHKVKEVNISACGIAFMANEPIELGGIVSLDLVLQPTNLHVLTYGTVVGCDLLQACSHNYYIRANFHGLSLQDQELLIQHIVKRQGDLIRESRDKTPVVE